MDFSTKVKAKNNNSIFERFYFWDILFSRCLIWVSHLVSRFLYSSSLSSPIISYPPFICASYVIHADLSKFYKALSQCLAPIGIKSGRWVIEVNEVPGWINERRPVRGVRGTAGTGRRGIRRETRIEESATPDDGLPETPICRFGTLEEKRGARWMARTFPWRYYEDRSRARRRERSREGMPCIHASVK